MTEINMLCAVPAQPGWEAAMPEVDEEGLIVDLTMTPVVAWTVDLFYSAELVPRMAEPVFLLDPDNYKGLYSALKTPEGVFIDMDGITYASKEELLQRLRERPLINTRYRPGRPSRRNRGKVSE